MPYSYPRCTQFKFNTKVKPKAQIKIKVKASQSLVNRITDKPIILITQKREWIRETCIYYLKKGHTCTCIDRIKENMENQLVKPAKSNKCFKAEKCKCRRTI